MTAMFDSDPGGNVSTDPIYTEKIYESLCNLETILLGGKSKWPKTIEGCEKYTADIIKQLQKSEACLIS